MFPNTSTQSQDHALASKDGCSRALDYIVDQEIENSFKSKTENPGKFPGKRKSPSDYRRDRKRKPPGKGMPTPGNHEVG